MITRFMAQSAPLRLKTVRAPAALLAATAVGLLPMSLQAQPQDDFVVIVGNPGEVLEEGIETSVQGRTALDAVEIQLVGLQRILDDIRNRRRGDRAKLEQAEEEEASAGFGKPSIAGRAFEDFVVQTGAPAASDGDGSEIGTAFGRLNLFGDAFTSTGEHDGSRFTPEHEADAIGVNFGADYRIGSDLVVGGVVGLINRETDFKQRNSQIELNGINIAALASWYITQSWYLDGIVRAGWNDYDNFREVAPGVIADSKNDGSDYAASLATGFEFYRGGLTIGPRVRVNYTDASIDGYTENAPTGALAYGDQDVESLTTNVGVEATYAINREFGVLLPQIDLEWVHEFEDDRRFIKAQNAGGGPIFFIPVAEPDSDYARVGLGATFVYAGGAIVFLRADAELAREDVDERLITLGTRLEF
ncbi:MAG: hypothetical protein CMN28_16520 [Salinisphaeraceae bacterium]|nr:hypothetical protein [Salinisphaeraceae bacterium]